MPRGLLGRILQLRSFQCPSCGDWQQLGLDEQTLQHLRAQQQLGVHADSRQSGAEQSGEGGPDPVAVGEGGLGPHRQTDYRSGLLPDPRQLLSRNGSYDRAGLYAAVRPPTHLILVAKDGQYGLYQSMI